MLIKRYTPYAFMKLFTINDIKEIFGQIENSLGFEKHWLNFV